MKSALLKKIEVKYVSDRKLQVTVVSSTFHPQIETITQQVPILPHEIAGTIQKIIMPTNLVK